MPEFSLDSETALIQPALLAPALACVSWGNEIGGTGLWSHEHAGNNLPELLEKAEKIVTANGAYDFAVLMEEYPHLTKLIFDLYRDKKVVDILLDQQLIDIARGVLGGYKDHRGFFHRYSYSLDAVTQRHGGEPLDKNTWRLKYGQLRSVPFHLWEPGAKQYPEKDASATMFGRKAQKKWAEYTVNGPEQAAAAFPLHLQSAWGIRSCPEQCARVLDATNGVVKKAEVSCKDAGIVDKAGKRKMSLARDLLLSKRDPEDEIRLTDTGVKKLDQYGRDSLPIWELKKLGLEKYAALDEEACIDSGKPELEAFAIYGSSKTRIKKIQLLAQGNFTALQTRFDTLKETGRTSSRAPGPPLIGDNFQNFARSAGTVRELCQCGQIHTDEHKGANHSKSGKCVITPSPNSTFEMFGPFPTKGKAKAFLRSIDPRGCIIPRPGYVFCSVDYDGAELHTLAQVCIWAVGRSRLAEVLNQGLDPHLLLGAERLLAFKLSYEEALKRKKEYEISFARQTAKVPNFGLPGGLGARTLVKYAKGYGVTLTLAQSEALIEAWHETWPEMADYFAWIREQLQDGVATIQQFVSGRIRGLVPYTVACNTYFQGLAADAAKSALLPLARECYVQEDESPLFGSRPVLFIHDEVISEIPEDLASEAAPRKAQIMVECFNKYVPDCPVTASPALMHRWSKDAEPVYENGKLVPWVAEAA